MLQARRDLTIQALAARAGTISLPDHIRPDRVFIDPDGRPCVIGTVPGEHDSTEDVILVRGHDNPPQKLGEWRYTGPIGDTNTMSLSGCWVKLLGWLNGRPVFFVEHEYGSLDSDMNEPWNLDSDEKDCILWGDEVMFGGRAMEAATLTPQGVMWVELLKDSPAQHALMLNGDLVMRVDNRYRSLTSVGDGAVIGIERDTFCSNEGDFGAAVRFDRDGATDLGDANDVVIAPDGKPMLFTLPQMNVRPADFDAPDRTYDRGIRYRRGAALIGLYDAVGPLEPQEDGTYAYWAVTGWNLTRTTFGLHPDRHRS